MNIGVLTTPPGQEPVTTVSARPKTIPSAPSGTLVDPIEITVSGGTSLRYDTTTGQFVQNWKTPKGTGALCATIHLADGSTISANFLLK